MNIPQIDKVKDEVELRSKYSDKLNINARTPPKKIINNAGIMLEVLSLANRNSEVKNGRPLNKGFDDQLNY